MKPKITVFFDYVCPYCLLAEDTITQVAEEHGLEVEWKPFELRPYPTPTLRPEDDYLPTVWNRSVYPMARRMGVPIKLPTISPQPYSHTAFEGLVYARERGREREYNDRVLRAFFQEDRDIGDIDVLTDLAGELGLDRAGFRAALEERRYEREHREALAEAEAAAVEAVPTVLVGAYRFAGVPTRVQLTNLVVKALADADRTAVGG
jgi:predicted DsbA family dithiol-disulfide isomerase